MAQRVLNMLFKADTRQAISAIDDLAGKAGVGEAPGSGIAGILGGLNKATVAAAAFSGAVLAAGTVVKNSINDYSNYVSEVDDLAASLNITTEEASFLMDAMESSDISTNTLISTFGKLAKEGYEPSVEGLGEFLLELDNMTDSADRAETALKMLGTQGIAELLPWFDDLTEAEKAAFGAQEEGVRVTDDMIGKNKEFQDALAELTDEWIIFKMELLEGVIPALTQTLEALIKTIGGMKEFMSIPISEKGFFESYSPSYIEEITKRPRTREIPSGWGGLSKGYQSGGSFIVGGAGGADSVPVSFMATPGETVSVGGGTNDNQQILAEVRRLVDTLPVILVDALERR